MSDDARYSKRGFLGLGVRRAKEAAAVGAEFALERFADRFTPRVQRPPGAIAELEFLIACTRCGECVRACPVGAILTLDEVVENPQVAANELLEESEHPAAGPMRAPRPAARFERTPATNRRPAPTLGQHTEEVLAELDAR